MMDGKMAAAGLKGGILGMDTDLPNLTTYILCDFIQSRVKLIPIDVL